MTTKMMMMLAQTARLRRTRTDWCVDTPISFAADSMCLVCIVFQLWLNSHCPRRGRVVLLGWQNGKDRSNQGEDDDDEDQDAMDRALFGEPSDEEDAPQEPEVQTLVREETGYLDPYPIGTNIQLVALPNFISIESSEYNAVEFREQLEAREAREAELQRVREEIEERQRRIAAGIATKEDLADEEEGSGDEDADDQVEAAEGSQKRRKKRSRRLSLSALEAANAGPVDASGRIRVKLGDEHTLRWRQIEMGGQLYNESNARFVQWDDGSVSLVLGDQIYDCTRTALTDNNMQLYEIDRRGVMARHVFRERVGFKPAGLRNAAHAQLAREVSKRTHQAQATKLLSVQVDHDAAKAEAMKREEEVNRQRRQRENQLRRAQRKRSGRVMASDLETSLRDDVRASHK
ncbi:uncharacterized protein MONBRDRAFT_6772 [Monosiga brevicollis MX1]|uniref:Uncharacterized protein n=1 Tax=Monosiga brevicollis TaxID=81824 RepID=A9UV96_MONBE|nr:uncharacterized protein MONBRDRAFT_6772 [Monosiga brevicollis MX1]EDQ90856.1 predicted protein [Monosiga brevicollis MX1]|eukprot:XP_001744153.1 hypothetical protein [Monosiga brevicollis MX1]